MLLAVAARARLLSLLACVQLALADAGCGRTEPFGTETFGPAGAREEAEDGGALGPDGGLDPADAGLDPADASGPSDRPNFPDLGFPNLPCDGCEDIRRILDGIRWESPCRGATGDATCRTDGPTRQVYNLRGAPGARYEVVLRFRGVVELRTYAGGYHEGRAWMLGGFPTANARNVFQLELSSPAETVYLNRTEDQAEHCHRIDYTLALRFDVGTALTTTVISRGEQLRNRDAAGRPIVVNGVPPAPAPYDGQLIQMNVQSIRRIR